MLNESHFIIPLRNGQLELVIEPSVHSLRLLLDFASRENPNRAYLFLSKVLGKYIPCLPSAMRKSYKDLAEMVTVTGNTLVLGVAETATGLGAGVAQEINNKSRCEVFYTQTTRYSFDEPLAYSINEKHSHAPQHLIYDMADNISLNNIENIVLVDDEISTGNTLAQITQCMTDYLPNLKTVHWVSLVNWMSEADCIRFIKDNVAYDFKFHSLLRGGFNYNHTTDHVIEFPKFAATSLSPAVCRQDIGRRGISVDLLNQMSFVYANNKIFTADDLDINEKYVVVGTSEFTFAPFLFAEMLEKDGYDVVFESTGRSPILKGGGISNKLRFYDPVHKSDYYLYNLPKDRAPIIMYETIQQLEMCPLHKLLNCKAVVLGMHT